MDNTQMRLMSKLQLQDEEAAKLLDSWFSDSMPRPHVALDMPVLERTVLATTTLKLNGIKAGNMGQDEWLTLAAALALTCLRGGEPVIRMTGRHFGTFDTLKIFILGHQWRGMSKRGLKYWYYGRDLSSNKDRSTTYYHIDKRGRHRGCFDAKSSLLSMS